MRIFKGKKPLGIFYRQLNGEKGRPELWYISTPGVSHHSHTFSRRLRCSVTNPLSFSHLTSHHEDLSLIGRNHCLGKRNATAWPQPSFRGVDTGARDCSRHHRDIKLRSWHRPTRKPRGPPKRTELVRQRWC